MVSDRFHFIARLGAAFVLSGALALPAGARTYCCNDKTGKRLCGDTLPEQCADRAYKEFGDSKVRSIEAPLSPQQKAEREAAEAKKKEEERAAAEQQRKDSALLNTYSSEKDIDVMRDRAIADMEANGKQAQDKYDAALKRKRKLERELEFYAKKPVPAELKAQIKENEAEILAQQKIIAEKEANVEATRARFEEDRKRYRVLMQGTAAKPAAGARPR